MMFLLYIQSASVRMTVTSMSFEMTMHTFLLVGSSDVKSSLSLLRMGVTKFLNAGTNLVSDSPCVIDTSLRRIPDVFEKINTQSLDVRSRS